jgi:hypothetical protein
MKKMVCALPPLAEVENAYLECYLEKMSSSTEYYVRYQILPNPMESAARNSSEFFLAVRAAAAVPDCVDQSAALDITQRTRYIWKGTSLQCQIEALGLPNEGANAAAVVDALCPPQYCLGNRFRLVGSLALCFLFGNLGLLFFVFSG